MVISGNLGESLLQWVSKKQQSSASHGPYSCTGERNRKHPSIYKIQTGRAASVRRWNTTVMAMCFKDHRLNALTFTELIPLLHIVPLQNRPSTIKIGRIWAIQFPDIIFLSFLGGLTEKISVFFVFRWILEIQHRPGKSCYFLISKGLPLNWTRNKGLISCPFAPFSYCWFLESLQCSMSPLRSGAFNMMWFIMWTECTVLWFLVFPV